MDRREFLTLALAGSVRAHNSLQGAPRPSVMTVRGRIAAEDLGLTLMHEHIMVDFVGADKVSPSRYDSSEVFQVALPHLKRVSELGCKTLVDCTPAYIGRDVKLLKRLSEASGLQILTTTGYYGAANDKFVPAHAYQESAEALAARWTREFERGIDGSSIKPGIIKIGVDAGPLSAIDAKLVKAAALAHLRTGLTIGSHTGDGIAALEQLDLIKSLGVGASAFIWIHAQSEKSRELHVRAAKRGCWVEFDGIRPGSVPLHLELVQNMATQGFLARTLVSMDAGWYHVGEPGGGNYRGYESLFLEFLPALKTKFTEAQINQLVVTNPMRALSLAVTK
jgi:phosphotriesterase-related protein